MTQRLPRYEQMRMMLRERIASGQISVGDRLPSVRQLREDYGVSFPTAQRAVRGLAEEGLVQTQPGSRGTFVISSEPFQEAPATTVACLLRSHRRPRNERDNFGIDFIQGIRDGISAHGYRFVYHCLDEVDYHRRMMDLVRHEWVCGVLLDQRVPLATIEALMKSGLPAVLVNRIELVQGLGCVAPDYERVGREGVRKLLAKGYRRIGFVAEYPREETEEALADGSHYPSRAVARGLRSAAAANGIAPNDLFLVVEPSTKERLPETPEAYGLPRRKPADWRPLGIVADSDTHALALLQALSMTDLVLGQDVGVVGCFDLPARRRIGPSLATWRIDPNALGEAAAAHLFASIEDPRRTASVVLLPPEFVKGESF